VADDAGKQPESTADDARRSRLSELGGYIRDQRENNKLSLRKLAKLAGVSNPYLSQIERGLRKPSAEILQAIAKALEISSETLYVRAGILEERLGQGDLADAIARDHWLTDAQRQALVEMYRSFRSLNEIQGRAAEEASAVDVAQDAAAAQSPARRFGEVLEALVQADPDDSDRASARREDAAEG